MAARFSGMRALWVAVLLACLLVPEVRAEDVWMDVDCAIGLVGSDVDDGLALVQAFHSPEVTVRGVSTVYGNAALAPGLPAAREVLARFGPAGMVPAPGAARASQLGQETPATRALAAALRERPLTVLALGPVTNVASLLLRHPELAPRIRRLVVVAGRRPGQAFRSSPAQKIPFRDFNFELDPRAMQVLLDSGVELWLAPWEVSSHVWITPEDLRALAGRSATGAWLWLRCQAWMRMWRQDLGAPGFNPFDTLAVGLLTHPGLIETRDVRIAIERGADDTGKPGRKPYLVCRDAPGGRRARYAWRPLEAFHDALLGRLGR